MSYRWDGGTVCLCVYAAAQDKKERDEEGREGQKQGSLFRVAGSFLSRYYSRSICTSRPMSNQERLKPPNKQESIIMHNTKEEKGVEIEQCHKEQLDRKSPPCVGDPLPIMMTLPMLLPGPSHHAYEENSIPWETLPAQT